VAKRNEDVSLIYAAVMLKLNKQLGYWKSIKRKN